MYFTLFFFQIINEARGKRYSYSDHIFHVIALQVQQMWAQENNITLISSGANNPRGGSGGTGIYVGTF